MPWYCFRDLKAQLTQKISLAKSTSRASDKGKPEKSMPLTSNAANRKPSLDGFSDKQHAALKQKSADIDRVEDDIKTIMKPVIDSHPSWSEHVTPDNRPNFDGTDPESLRSIENSLIFSSSDEESESASSPSYNPLRSSDMKTYGAAPIEEDIVVVKCKVCSKPILASNFTHHQGKGATFGAI
ncbi:unnamed protein product [Umbelopsis ramanniana]